MVITCDNCKCEIKHVDYIGNNGLCDKCYEGKNYDNGYDEPSVGMRKVCGKNDYKDNSKKYIQQFFQLFWGHLSEI